MKQVDLEFLEARPVVLRAWQRVEILLVGCGGTGSWLAPHLARLARLLAESGKAVSVTFIDPDHVEATNCSRQHFCPAEIGANKARTLAWRYGTALGLDIAAVERPFQPHLFAVPYQDPPLRLLVGCVDNAAARSTLAQALDRWNDNALRQKEPPVAWWLDCGNAAQSGQVLLGNVGYLKALQGAFDPETICRLLPSPAIQAPELLQALPEEGATHGLSCAELAVRNAQSLTINQAVAAVAADYVLRLLLTGDLRRFATYLDLPSGTTRSRYTTPAAVAAAIGKKPAFFRAPAAVAA